MRSRSVRSHIALRQNISRWWYLDVPGRPVRRAQPASRRAHLSQRQVGGKIVSCCAVIVSTPTATECISLQDAIFHLAHVGDPDLGVSDLGRPRTWAEVLVAGHGPAYADAPPQAPRRLRS